MTSEQQTADLLSLTADEALDRIGHDVTALRAYALALWIDRVEWRTIADELRTRVDELQKMIDEMQRKIDRLRDRARRARQELVMTGITLEDLP